MRPPPTGSFRRLLSEPLLHFLLLGVGVFALYDLVAPEEDEDRVIVVDAAIRERLGAELERAGGGPPPPERIEAAIEAWIDEEVLYREGLALGLDREDPLVRDRVVRNMTFFHEQSAAVTEPSSAELEAWFEQHRNLYTMPDRFDFEQAFAGESQARADALLAELRTGSAPAGEPFRLGRDFVRRSRGNVETLFGAPFANALAALPTGSWEILRSTHGLHVVRLTARHGGPADFEDLADRVASDWQRERRQLHAREAAKRLRESYVVRREAP